MVSREPRVVGKYPRPFILETAMSRILVLGGRGRLGAALVREWSRGHQVRALTRDDFDVADLPALERLLGEEEYDVLVNATGLTGVDQCETAREDASVVNAAAPGVMARATAARRRRLIHFSTDYVFDGKKSSPYVETDTPHPLGHYGRSKLAGEDAVLEASGRHLVVRVSWVFGPDKPSFIDWIVERALTTDHVEAVADKTSGPTYAVDVAAWLHPFLSGALPGGLFHASNAGSCTWQTYGQEALDCAVSLGIPLRTRKVAPVALSSMKQFIAARPPYSVLDTTKLSTLTSLNPQPWQDALAKYLSGKH